MILALLLACGGPPPAPPPLEEPEVREPPTDPEPTPEPVVAPVPSGCPVPAEATAPWRPATPADLVPEMVAFHRSIGLPDTCTVIQADLDGDGADDRVQLEVDGRRARLRWVMTRTLEPVVPLSWPELPEAKGGAVATRITLKPAGAPVLRDNADPALREALTAPAAIEVCAPLDGPEDVVTADVDMLCFCSTWLWWDGAGIRSGTTCD